MTSDQTPDYETPRGLVVFFFTPDRLYRREALRLRRSLRFLKLRFVGIEVDQSSDWSRTVLQKATWVRQVRETLRGPLLVVDSDSWFHSDPWPALNSFRASVACGVNSAGKPMSGTIFVSDTDEAREILNTWEKKCRVVLERAGDHGHILYELTDQFLLLDAIEQSLSQPPDGFVFLAEALCYVQNKNPGSKRVKPIIEHLQASRENSALNGPLVRRRLRIIALAVFALVRRLRLRPVMHQASPSQAAQNAEVRG